MKNYEMYDAEEAEIMELSDFKSNLKMNLILVAVSTVVITGFYLIATWAGAL